MHLVHNNALHFDRTVESYWEASADPLNLQLESLKQDINCDVAIVGGGFTGLSAAIELAQQNVDVCVLEAGPIGWGASGRNGGFACIGSHKLSYDSMIKTYGLEATKHFYNAMRDSIDRVAQNLSDFSIDAWRNGEGEMCLAHARNRIEEFREEQAFMKQNFGEELTVFSGEELRQQGYGGPNFFAGLKGNRGFGVHPLNYVRGLARAAHRAGAKLYPQSRVERWTEQDGVHHLHTAQGRVVAKRVLVATNGYTPEKLSTRHAGRILPALSSVIVTRPLTEDEKQEQGWTSSTMSYDSRILVHYFRLLPNNRFMFGGRGGTNSSNAAADGYRQQMVSEFHGMFPAWRNVEITHFWRGFVCLTYDRVPYIGALDEKKSVWTSLAYHGNGVAMASWSGRAVARMMTGKITTKEMPAVLTRRLAKFPLPMFRPLYLKGAYVWFGWQDAR